MPTPPAVVLSGHIMALGVVRSLGAAGIPAVVVRYRRDDMAHASRFVTRSVRAPHPEENEQGFIHALERLGPSLEGSPLFPASDETLVAVARHRELLSRWYRVAAPDAALMQRIVHKEHTYALADQIGMPAPRTMLVASEDDLERHRDQFPFPCLAKPSQSHLYQDLFGRKMVRVDGMDQLVAAYREGAAAGLQMMLQELIPGDDRQGANYNSYRVPGAPPVEFTAAKVRLTPRSFGPPSVVVSRAIPEIAEPARRLLDALGYEGYSCTEFKRDPRDGVYKLMEVNGRFNLSSLLMLRCGINLPAMAYRHLILGETPTGIEQPEGIHWIDGTKDLVYGLPELVRRPAGLPAFIRPYREPHVFAVFDRSDARPLAVRYRHLAGQGLALAARKLLGPLSRTRPARPG
jgi:predicted ATP-grasp superfamily ATP-dependent carboligase